MIFYDFEVFKYNWLIVALDMEARKKYTIWDDPEKLENLYSKNKSEIWIGFNSRHYDQYIFKGILAGFNPIEINNWIIVENLPGWQFSGLLRRFPLNNYDVMNGIDRGLKVFEGFLGNSICESSVPFDIDRPLTEAEKIETEKYCTHDVEQTVEVFIQRKSDFEAHMGLLEMFEMPLSNISKTKVQLSAEILEAQRPIQPYDDEFDISFPPTLRIEKYQNVVDWYKNPENRKYRIDPEDKKSKKMQLKTIIAGVPHVFGWGGVHGAIEQYCDEGYFLNMDVASLYPSLMIRYNLHSRSCNPEKYNEIVQTRLKFKAEKNPLQAPLKIVINGTYGAMKDKNNPLYDPRQANNVCVYGQLLLLDLMERLETVPGLKIIQSNTDGILVKMARYEDYDLIDDICHEWETRTGLTLEFDEYRKVFQKDVNNYVIVDADGHYKSKGAYVKKLGELDYDLPIVNKAMVDFMVNGIPVETTILWCNSLKKFRQVRSISKKYKYILHGGEILKERCVRCFASKRPSDGGLTKVHSVTGTTAKLEGTPENAFLWNDSVEGVRCPRKIDKNWYIKLANKRLQGFGVI